MGQRPGDRRPTAPDRGVQALNVETQATPATQDVAVAAPAPVRPETPERVGTPVVIRIWRRLLRDPSLAVTLGYVFVSFIGLWSSYWFYRGFRLPILEYMQASDFLVAGLRDPAYAILLFASIGIAAAVSWPETYRREQPERVEAMRQRWWGRYVFSNWKWGRWSSIGMAHETGIVFGVMWGLIAASAAYVSTKGERIRDVGSGHRVEVTLAGDAAAQPQSARLLGTSSAFVFLWWPDRKVAEAVPIESIGRLTTVRSRPAKAAKAPPAAAPTPAAR